MTYFAIVSIAVAATFGAVSLAASGLLVLVWPAAEKRLASWPPARRARGLFALRLVPTALALLASASVTLPAFLEFEPRDTHEVAGRVLVALAAVGMGLLGLAGARFLWSAARTSSVARRFTATAAPAALPGTELLTMRLETPIPVVALHGWRRPRLYVSAAVLDGCAPRLLAAMAAHEIGHQRARDNLRGLLLSSCADPLTLIATGRRIVAAWEVAAEEAADDAAVEAGTQPQALIDALLAVARLAPAARWSSVPSPASAFYRGEALERRVRRLLDARPYDPTRSGRRRGRRVAAAALLLLAWLVAADWLHRPVFQLVEQGVDHPGRASTSAGSK
jgi:Zn-dependent protease with chaperone function